MVTMQVIGYTSGDPQKVDVTGDQMTGNLTLQGSAGQSLNLYMKSSFAGGENNYDSTSRMILESYQRAQLTAVGGGPGHFGEVLRITSKRWDSKQMITWDGPTSYDANGDPVGANTSWFWMGAHYEANDHQSVHGHWSVEVPDTAKQLQTRFDMAIWNPVTGEFGMDVGRARFYQTHLGIDNNGGIWFDYSTGNSGFGHGSSYPTTIEAKLDVKNSGVLSTAKFAATGENTASIAVVRIETPTAPKRGLDLRVTGDGVSRVRLDSSGTNGSGAVTLGDGTTADVRLYRSAADVLSTDDSMVVAVRQSVGTATLNSRKFYVEDSAGSSQTALFKALASGSTTQAVVAIETADATKRMLDMRTTGDNVSRLRVEYNANGSGQILFGDGTTADVNLYREMANVLRTDDTIVVNSTGSTSALSSFNGGYGNSTAFKGVVLLGQRNTDDVGGAVDGTARLYSIHMQRANSYSFGEWHRAIMWYSDAKAMDSNYVPVLNGKVAYNADRTPMTGASWSPASWTGTHFEANDHVSIHGHWELELPDENGELQGRLEAPYIDQTQSDGLGNTTFGIAYTNIRTNLADLSVRAQLMTAGTYAGQVTCFRIGGNNTINKDIKFNISSDMTDAGRRVTLRLNTDSETGGGNVGSNFVIVRYDNNGSQLGTGAFMERSSGNWTFGATGSVSARIGIVWSSGNGFSAQPSSSPGTSAAYDATMTATTDRAYQSRVSGDTSARFLVFADGKHEWGDGSSRDTNLYRIGANRLATDDSFTITAGELSIGAGLTGNSIFSYTNASATNNGLNLTNTASAGNTGSPHVRMESATSTSISFTSRVTGDASSRFLQTITGEMQWGDGTNARDAKLYRNAAGVLKTDTDLTVRKLAAGAAPDASLVYGTGVGDVRVARFVITAEGTASVPVLQLETTTTAKRAFDYRLTGDGVSRIRMDASATGNGGTITFGDGTTADTNLYRNGADQLKTDDKFLAVGGLGVGNSSTATSAVGTLTRKIEIFDSTGASLGFIPVYASIS